MAYSKRKWKRHNSRRLAKIISYKETVLANHTFIVPRRLDLEGAFGFVAELKRAPEAEEYIFDFSYLKWVEPFSLLYISCAIAIFDGLKEKSKVGVSNYKNFACGYASHLGFFKSFRIDHGKMPGEARNSSNYIPITILNIEDLKQEASEKRVPVGEILEIHADEYAKVITREKDGALVDTLKFTLREMMRNVVEHSGATQIGFCAQYWPSRNIVELSILDTGRGLRDSLLGNPYLDKDMDDTAAINYALLPGISGTMFKGKFSDPYDEWQNSGYGLYMASEICRHGGDFVICSGRSAMKLESKEKSYYESPLNATAIRMRLNTEDLRPTKESLGEYRKKGERVAKEIYGANLSASAASSMLTKDFSES